MISFKLAKVLCSTASSGFFSLEGDGEAAVKSIVTDSRKVSEGSLYVPLKGERFDGHDFIQSAVRAGAAAVLCDKEHYADIKDFLSENKIPVLICDDTRLGLGKLAAMQRELHPSTHFLGLTGSCGKTTVKELTAAILSKVGKTQWTQGNFNNDIGVPLTLLSIDEDTKFAVIEQGANHPGEIAYTCGFVQSEIALINNAGGAHIEGFGSNYGIFKAKSEILDDVFLRKGVGIVPSDSEFRDEWLKRYPKEYKEGRLRFFGTHEEDFVRVFGIKPQADAVSFTLGYKGHIGDITLPLPGYHNALNAAAAAALALSAGADFSHVLEGLFSVTAISGRLHQEKLSCGTLIDDSYNASFHSVIAACEVLKLQKGFKIFCFGDMGELGAEAERLHEEVGVKAASCCDLLMCFGRLSKLTAQACLKNAGTAQFFGTDKEALTADLKTHLDKGMVCVLCKGSHSMKMNEIADFMRKNYSC